MLTQIFARLALMPPRRPTGRMGRADRERRTDGSVSIEFALIVPVCLLFLVGASEIFSYLDASRRATNATRLIGDLIAQEQSLTKENLADIEFAARELIRPLSIKDFSLTITSMVGKTGEEREGVVLWSWTLGNSQPRAVNETLALPEGVTLSPGEGLILSESKLRYTSPTTLIFSSKKLYSDRVYHWPRSGSILGCEDCSN